MKGQLISHDEQIARWVAGESIHRATTEHAFLTRTMDTHWKCVDCDEVGTLAALRAKPCANPSGECVPDFSCCHPELADPLEKRRAYAESHVARRATRDGGAK